MATSHRLDLLLVPADASLTEDAGRRLLDDLVGDGTIAADGRPGPAAGTWCDGGFTRVSLDRPVPAPDGTALWSNRVGGFRVTCPSTGGAIVAAFGAAVTAWRQGGPRSLRCPSCRDVHSLDALGYAPPAAFGPWAIVTADAGAPALTPSGAARAEGRIGRSTLVLRRG